MFKELIDRKMTAAMKQGLITIVPKPNKDYLLLKIGGLFHF